MRAIKIERKLCIDCKWCQIEPSTCRDNDLCMHPELKKAYKNYRFVPNYAEMERELGSCGENAKYWEEV